MQIEQCKRQLEDLVPVWAVLDYTNSNVIEREMVLVKVSTVPGHMVDEMTQSELESAEESGTLNIEVRSTMEVNLTQLSLREFHPSCQQACNVILSLPSRSCLVATFSTFLTSLSFSNFAPNHPVLMHS